MGGRVGGSMRGPQRQANNLVKERENETAQAERDIASPCESLLPCVSGLANQV